MTLLSGNNWSGNLHFDITAKASGKVNGHAWYFQSKSNSLTLEIAEDYAIGSNDLPLVGYGCAGWLYECDNSNLPGNETDFIHYINKKLSIVFTLFHQNKLKYLPLVTSACND